MIMARENLADNEKIFIKLYGSNHASSKLFKKIK